MPVRARVMMAVPAADPTRLPLLLAKMIGSSLEFRLRSFSVAIALSANWKLPG